jgi:hypothetical protein
MKNLSMKRHYSIPSAEEASLYVHDRFFYIAIDELEYWPIDVGQEEPPSIPRGGFLHAKGLNID